MPHTLVARLTYAIFSIICLLALWRGNRPQKLAGAVLLVATITTPLIQDRIHWMDPEARFLIEDCVLLLFFLFIAVRYGRIWMIFAASFQILSTLSHPAAHVSRQIGPYPYIFVYQLFSYGVFLSLGAGVLSKWWREISSHSAARMSS